MAIQSGHDYPTVFTVHATPTVAVLAAGVPVQIVPPNNHRKMLTLQVTGAAPATFGFGAAPASAGAGISLDGASSAGGQGGSYEFKDIIPMDGIWALSALGTTVVVLEGV